MTDELYIGGVRVDLESKTTIGLDYYATDIGDLKNRKCNKSNSINIPFTKTNLQIFGYCNVPDVNSVVPYSNFDVIYKKYGIEIINRGKLVIDEITEEGFSCNLYWGLFDFFESIKSEKINDIDFSDLEEDWTQLNILAKIAATTGLTYPIIDWHADSPNLLMNNTGTSIIGSNVYPAIFEKTIFDRIFEGTGFNYIMSPSVIGFENKIVPLIDRKADQALMDVFKVRRSSGLEPVIVEDNLINFETNIYDPYGKMSNGYRFYVPITGTYTFDFTCSYTISFLFNPYTVTFKIIHYSAGGVVKSEFAQAFSSDIIEERLFQMVGENCDSGDYIECHVINSEAFLYIASSSFYVSNVELKNCDFFYRYPIGVNLPSISKSDFIKNIMQRYCLFLSQVENTVYFIKLDDIINNKGKAVNLNDKVVSSKRAYDNLKYDIEGYARRNYFKYKEDTTVLNDYDSYISCNNNNLELEKTIFTSPYSACDDVIRMNGIKMANIKKLVNNVDSSKVSPKILSSYQNTSPISIWAVPCTLYNVGVFDENTRTDSLDWEDLLIENFNILSSILENPKQIKVMVDWKLIDYLNIKVDVPYFLWNSFYMLKRIQNFSSDKLTELELIKI